MDATVTTVSSGLYGIFFSWRQQQRRALKVYFFYSWLALREFSLGATQPWDDDAHLMSSLTPIGSIELQPPDSTGSKKKLIGPLWMLSTESSFSYITNTLHPVWRVTWFFWRVAASPPSKKADTVPARPPLAFHPRGGKSSSLCHPSAAPRNWPAAFFSQPELPLFLIGPPAASPFNIHIAQRPFSCQPFLKSALDLIHVQPSPFLPPSALRRGLFLFIYFKVHQKRVPLLARALPPSPPWVSCS